MDTITIAIVEDSRMTAAFAREHLDRQHDLSVVGIAHSAAEGRTLCPAVAPRVAIVDWMLGDGDGLELIDQLAPSLPETRWLIVSDWGDASLIREADRACLAGVIDKRDYADGELPRAVRAVARGGEHWCPASVELLLRIRRDPSHYQLSPVEREILDRLAEYESRAAIARALDRDPSLVSRDIRAIARKIRLLEAPGAPITVPSLIDQARTARFLPRVPSRGKRR